MPRTETVPADIIEVYTDNGDTFRQAVSEWRDSSRVAKVRTAKRTVRAFGAVSEVHVVCVWWTEQARVMGWDT